MSRAVITGREAVSGARRRARWPVAVALVCALLILSSAAYYIPTGWAIVGPGEVLRLMPATEVVWAGGSDSTTVVAPGGEVLMLTISVQRASLYRLVAWAAGLLPDVAAVRVRELMPNGLTDTEYLSFSREQMAESIGIAATVAHWQLGLPASTGGSGVRVVSLAHGLPVAESGLRTGDVILAAGTPVATTSELVAALRRYRPGDGVILEVLRDDRLVTLTATIYAVQAGAEESMLGATLATVSPRFTVRHRVTVDTGGIAGPSGGLAIALASYVKLSGDDVLAGRTVAATGYIRGDATGSIGPVGGVGFKAIAAAAAGAEILLVHPANLAEAEAAGASLSIVGVASLSEALAYLRGSSLTGPK